MTRTIRVQLLYQVILYQSNIREAQDDMMADTEGNAERADGDGRPGRKVGVGQRCVSTVVVRASYYYVYNSCVCVLSSTV